MKQRSFEFKIISSGLLTLIFKFGSIGSNYLLYFLIATFSGSHLVGQFSLFVTFLNISIIVTKTGTDTFLVKSSAQKKGKDDFGLNTLLGKILLLVLLNSIIASGVIFLMSDQISSLFASSDIDFDIIMKLAILIPITATLSIISEFHRGCERFLQYNLFQDFLRFVLTLIGYWSLYTVYEISPMDLLIIATFITLILGIISIKNNLNRESIILKKQQITSIFNSSYHFFLSNAAYFLTSWTSILILGVYASSSEVGIFTTAFKISNILIISIMAVNSVAMPNFAKYDIITERKSIQGLAIKTSKIMFWMSFPIFICILLFAEHLLGFFGEEFIIGKTSLILISIGQLVNLLSGSNGSVLKMTGHQHIFQRIIMFGAILNIVLNFLLVPLYGIIGAAYSVMITTITWNLMGTLYARIFLKIRTYFIIPI